MATRTTALALLFLLALSGTGGVLLAGPAFGQTLSLTVSSPAPGTTFNRGETVTLTASVTNGGSPVSGAAVAANSPAGAAIPLAETAAGTYSSTYPISPTDPVGTWTITIIATSGGQSASARFSVTISDALVVTFTSPPSLTTFNVGETAAVKSTVTYQDGAAIPSSASVTFTSPAGTKVAMSRDAADPSGKTWTGTHAVTAVDVPTQGFDWPITVSASVGGATGTATQHVTLYSSLLVAVSIFTSGAYTAPGTVFSTGQTVFVETAVTLHDATAVSSGAVSFEISGTGVASAPIAMAFSPSLEAWTGSYTVLSTDASGAQTVTVSAADGLGNAGTGSHTIKIQTSTQGLAVSITSPAPGSVINRGETASIAALVTLGGAPVSGAAVTAESPSGATITLANTAGGDYSASYQISSTDPTGAWTLAVQAVQGAQLAASQESVTVSGTLKVAVSAFSSYSFVTPESSFSTGQTAYVKAQVAFQDGFPVATGAVTFELTGSSIASMPVTMTFDSSLQAWTGSYTVQQSDQTGGQVISVAASDGSSNSGSGAENISINALQTTSRGLEASITFDPSAHDIAVSAVCGTGCVAPTSVTVTNATQGWGHGQGRGWSWMAGDQGHGKGHGEGRSHQGGEGRGAAQLRVYTISDSAGHKVTLTVLVRNTGHQVRAEVTGIQYESGATVRPARNVLDFQYALAQDGSLKVLQEGAHVNGTNAVAHYDANKGNTTIAIGTGHEGDGGRTSVTKSGLWLLELTTSQGALSVDYAQSG